MNRFKIVKHNEGFSFVLQAQNGALMLTSMPYASKQDCQQAMDTFLQHGTHELMYDKKTDDEGFHYFDLTDKKGTLLATSERYASISGIENSIYSVKQAIADAFAYS